ncbi:hypothetical protein LPB72_16865 [Hydrogenophaga crassostreae]|uniref:Uncharacterized protein n=1 Tax=Hydrogenophaga crassostreae TaxID=1763535 RepID=A0A167H9T0_9BURK|nr:hypothetical protein [Hydrogenophaga crassostreae]AOW12688.1 hypothetical protein LPB072_07380 [Hydrogenophaga crassostreae]OAD40561.1 hypothetical protein LPB72_16865 [Hydrogenophaga crassostreae]
MSHGPTPHAAILSPAERKALALHRIEASRTQLIVHVYPEPVRRPHAGDKSSTQPPVWNGLAGLMARAERNGLVNAVWRTTRALGRRWWTRQPWHASVDLVAGTLAHEAKPIIRQHPWAALAVGGAAGAAVVVILPWITRSIKAQADPWRNNLGGMVWQQLSQAPVQLALTGALTAWIADINKRSAAKECEHPASAAPTTADSPEASPR